MKPLEHRFGHAPNRPEDVSPESWHVMYSSATIKSAMDKLCCLLHARKREVLAMVFRHGCVDRTQFEGVNFHLPPQY